MRRRYVIGAGIGAACIFVVLGLAAILPESEVTKARYDSVEVGMTMEAVEAILGTPPREVYEFPFARGHGSVTIRRWVNEDGSGAEIFFEVGGTVCGKRWYDSSETIGEKLRRWTRWQWW